MTEIQHSSSCFTLDSIQHLYERTSGKSRELRFAHLGCGHHLHRFGDLRSAADGPYAPPQVTWAVHKSIVRGPKVVLNEPRFVRISSKFA
jgi:hypothetical protein